MGRKSRQCRRNHGYGKDLARTKQLTEPNQAIALHIVKNRGGEKVQLAFDFYPSFAKFTEAD